MWLPHLSEVAPRLGPPLKVVQRCEHPRQKKVQKRVPTRQVVEPLLLPWEGKPEAQVVEPLHPGRVRDLVSLKRDVRPGWPDGPLPTPHLLKLPLG